MPYNLLYVGFCESILLCSGDKFMVMTSVEGCLCVTHGDVVFA